ncbi:peptidoglycan DD-metalloendopeptidase family protein [Coleofasciculus sp. FACHB-501]|uniref:peptidoglycan DD-metalloendopeptidase family protein n=1 Tax=Cyanophyceae TaxID=3028117 RepID=UPI001681E9DD|nr:peptidoglycan DD-metalloendopeptidase family protein [Coleofasciculus sp. FACHB-501]MBD1839673.1 peptidoglycan DD-metalloendopeptidase family protein [Coleofasciculus sp. FACHB-501]
MKRPFTHKIKSVPSCAADKDAKANLSAGKLSGGESGLLKPISPEVNRRARTSAAMIGLAISMGTSSLLLPQQGDEAKAADPVATEPTVTNAPAATDIAVAAPASKVEPETTASVAAIKPESKSVAASPKVVEPEFTSEAVSPKVELDAKAESKPAPRVIEHKVQQAQTIWQSSKNYGVEPAAIATSNNIKSSSALPSGQVVKIPSVNGIVHEVKLGDTVEKLSESYGVRPIQVQQSSGATTSDGLPVGQSVTIPGNVNELLKARQDAAMSRLKEQRSRLQNSLAELRSEETTKASAGQLEVTEPAQIDNSEAAEVEIAAPRVQIPVAVQMPGENAPNQVINQVPSVPRNIAVQMPGENAPNQVINQLPSVPRNIAVQMPGENASNRVINHLPSAQARESLEASPQAIGVNESVPIPVPTATNQALPIQTVAPAPIAVVEPNGVTADVYQVKAGDTVDAIARIHGVSRGELLRINQLDNPNMIRVNQALKIPKKQTVTVIPGLNAALRQSKSNVAVPNLSVPTLPTAVPLPVAATQVRVQSSANVPIVKPMLVAGNPLPIATPAATPIAERNQTQSAGLKQNSEYSTQIEKLREDIIKLRQQYRTQQNGDTANSQNVPVANISVPVTPAFEPVAPVVNKPLQRSEYSTPINPEFSPNRYNEAVQAEMQKRQRQQQRSQAAIEIKVPPPAAPRARTQKPLVAAAPSGADTYNPTLRPPFGQQVAPELPPLPGPNPYLPDSQIQFNGYIWPSKGVLTSGYGRRWGRMHKGIDIAAPVGTPVVAAAPGVVVYARWNSGGYGNLVDIQHPDGSLTRYAHNNRLLVREGEAVEQGQQISEMGSTGRSTGPHLHFELHPSGKGAINPIALLPRR